MSASVRVGQDRDVARQQSYRDLADWLLTHPPRLGATRLVTVDGPAGAGKTTFALRLADRFHDVRVIHLDDLYEGWAGLDAGLWQRLDQGLLVPIAAGRAGGYRRYDWGAGAFAEWQEVAPPQLLIVEGVGSGQRGVDARATLRVWVDAPQALRLERGLQRDGDALRPQWTRWLRSEAVHFAQHDTQARADLVVDGAAPAPSDAAYAVVTDRRLVPPGPAG